MSVKQLIVGASGIYISYLTSSIISQKLYSIPYPSIKNPAEQAKFNYPGLIVWFSSLLCFLFGYVKGMVNNQITNPIPIQEQMILGFLSTINMLCANYALLYITYLEQALGRNCRYLMVVLIGAYFSRVKKGSSLKLPAKKVAVAAVITTGVLLFTILGNSNKHGKQIESPDHWKGYVMLALSIIADALFSDSQAYSKAHFKPTSNHLFTCAQLYTFLYVFLFSIVSGQAISQIKFCINHPSVISDILAMSVLQVIGQVSIYYVIVNFKQHMFPLISTTRKVLTVFLSIVIFGHHLSGWQWFAVGLVFLGLIYELNDELSDKKKHGEKSPAQIPKQAEQKQKQVKQLKNSIPATAANQQSTITAKKVE